MLGDFGALRTLDMAAPNACHLGYGRAFGLDKGRAFRARAGLPLGI